MVKVCFLKGMEAQKLDTTGYNEFFFIAAALLNRTLEFYYI